MKAKPPLSLQSLRKMMSYRKKPKKLLLLGIKEASLENYLFNTATDVRTITDKKKKNVFVLNVKTILVAASIALVVGLFTWFVFQNRDQNKQIYSQYYSPDPGLATVMSVVSRV